MPDRSLIDVVRAAVADVAPDELADFEVVARGYAASAAKRGWPWHTESTPSASVVAGQPVATTPAIATRPSSAARGGC